MHQNNEILQSETQARTFRSWTGRNALVWRKRVFDLVVSLFLAMALLPLLSLCTAAILVLEGRPVLYRSHRRVYGSRSLRVVKFRTMRRNADVLLNRDTVPHDDGVRFLNIPIDSPAYTGIGRLIERTMMTEMPQLIHVMRGDMSIIGNRPLPENVIVALSRVHGNVEDRFLVPAGLTGPAQLVGRDFLSDAERLQVETVYCEAVLRSYSIMLDVRILFYTMLIGFLPRYRFTPAEVIALLRPRAEPAEQPESWARRWMASWRAN